MTAIPPRFFLTGALAIGACGGLPGVRPHPEASLQGHRYQPPAAVSFLLEGAT
jgi:hypothetical protein